MSPITRRRALQAGATTLLAGATSQMAFAKGTVGEHAESLVHSSIIINPSALVARFDQSIGKGGLSRPGSSTAAPRYTEQSSLTVGPVCGSAPSDLAMRNHALAFIDRLNAGARDSATTHTKIETVQDLARSAAAPDMFIVAIDEVEHFQRPGDVAMFQRMGQRIARLGTRCRHPLGAGRQQGLSHTGHAIIHRMNRAGIVIDVSSCRRGAAAEIASVSSSGVSAISAGADLLTDRLAITAIARSGGVIGIALADGLQSLEHFDRIVQHAGPAHIGLGRGFADAPAIIDLAEGLIRRGFSDEDIQGILGRNYLRAFGEIWHG